MGYIPDPGARPDIDKVTENYELAVPIPEPSGGADIIAIWEENYEKIDNQMKANADNISEIDLSKKTDTGYLQGGLLLGLTSLVSDTQYLAGDGFWYKLKATTTSPYTHDSSDTPDADFLEKITHKSTSDKVENLLENTRVLLNGTQAVSSSVQYSNVDASEWKILEFQKAIGNSLFSGVGITFAYLKEFGSAEFTEVYGNLGVYQEGFKITYDDAEKTLTFTYVSYGGTAANDTLKNIMLIK